MKLIEKMAFDWHQEEIKKRPLQPFEDYYKANRAFEAGFRACKEMAEKLHRDGRKGTGMCDVCSNDGEWLYEEMVKNMGDEEVTQPQNEVGPVMAEFDVRENW